MINLENINNDEKIIFNLRSLYENYGYAQYKMNKFEEYDYYVRNKDFLVSSNIISFTDTDGKLMALKPDVTLSIIKNGNDKKNNLQKVYYNENVYRIPKNSSSFKEIMQVGLECIGQVDDYSVFEVLLLAIKSLESISNDFVLDISNIGIVKEIIADLELSGIEQKELIKCFSEKNIHDLIKIKGGEKLSKLIENYGSVEKVEKILSDIFPNGLSKSANLLIATVKALENYGYKNKIRIDFSVLNDMTYYSGIVFNGFVKNVPTSVLSGGQYDNLMKKNGRKDKAIGFAVYLDLLSQFEEKEYDVDTIVLYDENCSVQKVNEMVNQLVEKNNSVLAIKKIPKELKYKKVIELRG